MAHGGHVTTPVVFVEETLLPTLEVGLLGSRGGGWLGVECEGVGGGGGGGVLVPRLNNVGHPGVMRLWVGSVGVSNRAD
jgi:hypothetical protein